MDRVILRHLKGSKASQVEEFPLQGFSELVLGRDPNSGVRFDPEKDDLVGRQHARIARDPADPYRFTVTDLNSRNGTYLNKLRVVGTMPLQPGDVVQLGAGGPEMQFELDPLPAQYVKQTRMAMGPGGINETRAGATAGGAGLAPTAAGAVTEAPKNPNSVGKATVERMIGQTKSEGKRNTWMVAGAAVVLIAAVGGYAMKQNADAKKELSGQIGAQGAATGRAVLLAGMMTPAEIAAKYSSAVVTVDFAWNLIYTPTGAQVYHRFIPNKYKGSDGRVRPIIDDGRESVPAYVSVDGGVEPDLTLSADGGKPIAVASSGSGFVVTADGFILTNRHVAANWRTWYRFDPKATGPVLTNDGKVQLQGDGSPMITRPPGNWTPSETKQYGPKQDLGNFRGRQEYLMVRFRKNTNPVEATVQRVSDVHDVTLIKIANPGPVPNVTLFDSYDSTQVGDAVTVMGYPGIADEVVAVIKSKDMFNREAQQRVIPDPTLSQGNIGKILRAADGAADQNYMTFANSGDTYQLTINSTGGGNSGGPMFDAYGRVIGIYFAGKTGDAQISFSVPIRFGLALMTVAPNVK